MSWVLVVDGTDGQARSSLAAVRAAAAAGERVAVAVSGRPSLAAASRWCHRAVPAPPGTDPGFAAAVRQAAEALGADTVLVAGSDLAVRALGLPGAELTDKAELLRRAAAVGLPTPPTLLVQDRSELAAATPPFPCVAKPALSTRPARRVEDPAQLAAALADGPLLVQPYVDGPMTAVAGVVWDGRLVAAVHQRYLRTWPVHCGTASAAVTVGPDLDLEDRLVALLAEHHGVFQAQLRGGVLLDLNPRVYGSLPLAVAAGANLVAVYVACARGQVPRGVLRARTGVHYRWVEGDLRHLWWRWRRGELTVGGALGALRPRRGSAHSVWSLRDPLPALVRLWAVARRTRSRREVVGG